MAADIGTTEARSVSLGGAMIWKLRRNGDFNWIPHHIGTAFHK
jgi:hypothetical protein